MQPTPSSSFFRFLVGFLTFIGLSFGITIAAQTYVMEQSVQQEAAAAKALMLQKGN